MGSPLGHIPVDRDSEDDSDDSSGSNYSSEESGDDDSESEESGDDYPKPPTLVDVKVSPKGQQPKKSVVKASKRVKKVDKLPPKASRSSK